MRNIWVPQVLGDSLSQNRLKGVWLRPPSKQIPVLAEVSHNTPGSQCCFSPSSSQVWGAVAPTKILFRGRNALDQNGGVNCTCTGCKSSSLPGGVLSLSATRNSHAGHAAILHLPSSRATATRIRSSITLLGPGVPPSSSEVF